MQDDEEGAVSLLNAEHCLAWVRDDRSAAYPLHIAAWRVRLPPAFREVAEQACHCQSSNAACPLLKSSFMCLDARKLPKNNGEVGSLKEACAGNEAKWQL